MIMKFTINTKEQSIASWNIFVYDYNQPDDLLNLSVHNQNIITVKKTSTNSIHP